MWQELTWRNAREEQRTKARFNLAVR